MRNNLKILKHTLIISAFSYGLALFWWRGWMYQGFVGPIPLLHWVVPSDGEASYLLTEIEMFITLLVLSCLHLVPFYTIYCVIKMVTNVVQTKTHNKRQQSLPAVAGTAKTLRLLVCPCDGR